MHCLLLLDQQLILMRMSWKQNLKNWRVLSWRSNFFSLPQLLLLLLCMFKMVDYLLVLLSEKIPQKKMSLRHCKQRWHCKQLNVFVMKPFSGPLIDRLDCAPQVQIWCLTWILAVLEMELGAEFPKSRVCRCPKAGSRKAIVAARRTSQALQADDDGTTGTSSSGGKSVYFFFQMSLHVEAWPGRPSFKAVEVAALGPAQKEGPQNCGLPNAFEYSIKG